MDQVIARALFLVVLVLLATAFGLHRRHRSGRVRPVAGGEILTATDLGASLGERGTFLQFSAPTCAACRGVRRVLGDLVAATEGLAHVEVDVTDRPGLTRGFGVLRTPTTVVLDPGGRVTSRFSGPVTPAAAAAAVAVMPTGSGTTTGTTERTRPSTRSPR